MAKFNDAYLTDAGADLIAQSITDGVKIDFVRMEIGDGEYAEEEKSKDVLRKRTSLKNKRQESPFNSVEKAKDSAVKLKAAIDNRNVTTGYRMTEIGIFAKASGDTASDGVLYSIAVAAEADYMPPESTPITYIQEFYTKVGNAENVEITVSTGVYALAEDLAEVEEPTYTESEELEELTPGENLKLALGKLAKAVKEIIAHMALKATGSVAGHVKVSSSAAVTDSTGMALAATEKNASLEGTLAYKLEQLNTNLNNIGNYQQTDTLLVSSNLSANIDHEINALLLARGTWLIVSSGELNAHAPFAYNLGIKKSAGDLYGSSGYLCTPHTDTGIWADFLQTYTITVTSDTATVSTTIKHYAADSNVGIGWARMLAIRLA